jgi:hypothetical protein
MSRYKDADLLEKRIWELRRQYQLMDDTQTADVIMHGLYRAEQVLDDIPTVDVVPTKALRLFIEWADECGFGYDNIPDEYEKYKDDIKDMGWIEGLMYIVLKEAEENA